MRIGLIAALRRSDDGALCAALPLAGRSVLARQAALLQSLGAERVLCLVAEPAPATPAPDAGVLALQHGLEGQGVQFHALRGFGALPALVRDEDDLIVMADGLVPAPEVVQAVFGADGALRRGVASLPADHPVVSAHPDGFERIDAARRWAGVLVMRGAPVQQLADFPEDADAVSLLLRLALQAGTAPRDLAGFELVPEQWLLATSADAAGRHARALIAAALPAADPRAPGKAVAAALVAALVPRALGQGAQVSAGLALAALLAGIAASAAGFAAAGLLLAALGAFGSEAAQGFSRVAARLIHNNSEPRGAPMLGAAADIMAASIAALALAPPPVWQPLAMLGPVVIGLARIVSRSGDGRLAALAADRTALVLFLAFAAVFGLLAESLACLALGLVAALLLHAPRD